MARAAEANGVWRERGSLWSVMGTRGEGGGRLSRARQWRSADCGGELLEIMREADEVPLVLHLVEAAEQELSEAEIGRASCRARGEERVGGGARAGERRAVQRVC